MHEREKLAEARYFLQSMASEHDNRVNFRYALSAFLGAARSVLQYALDEAKTNAGGQIWYEQAMTKELLLAYFKDKRDTNIHSEPVVPSTSMTMQMSEHLLIDEETTIPFRHHTSEWRHRFADWPHDETVTELSERYLNLLDAFVADGLTRRLITG